MAQGEPYRLSEITGEAEPTMISPKAHSTTVSRAMAGAVPSRPTQPVGLEPAGSRGVGAAATVADCAAAADLAADLATDLAAVADRRRRRAFGPRGREPLTTPARSAGRSAGRRAGRRGRADPVPLGREGWRSRVAARGMVVRSATVLSSVRWGDDGHSWAGPGPTHSPSLLHQGLPVVEPPAGEGQAGIRPERPDRHQTLPTERKSP